MANIMFVSNFAINSNNLQQYDETANKINCIKLTFK